MPIDPKHRDLLRSVDRLTTQVRRIADTLADGTARGSFALAPPVVTDDDGAQTTGDDARRCVCGDPLQWYAALGGASGWVHDPTPGKPVLDVHTPRPAHTPTTSGAEKQRTIRRQQLRILLNQLNDGTTPLTTAQVQALTAYVADEIVECNMETQEADRLDAELDRIRRALDPDDETCIQETVDDQLAMTAKVAELEATIGRVREVQAWLARNYPGLKEPASRLFLALSPANKEG